MSLLRRISSKTETFTELFVLFEKLIAKNKVAFVESHVKRWFL